MYYKDYWRKIMMTKNLILKNRKFYKCSKKLKEVTCNTGLIWITYEKSCDIILKPGESLKFENRKKIIIQAMPECNACILY